MKYVRSDHEIRVVDEMTGLTLPWIDPDFSGKVADSVEELVDAFVYHKNIVPQSVKEEIKHYYGTRYTDPLYGSIWVGPDLHAVAVLEKNGKWRLL